ncbi:MAG: hypothetical protein AAF735_06320 [Myxococcota bacterium]
MDTNANPPNNPPTIEIVNEISKQLQYFGTNLNNWPVVLYDGTLTNIQVTYAYANSTEAGNTTDTLNDIKSGDNYTYNPGTINMFQLYESIAITVFAPGNKSNGDVSSSMSISIDLYSISPNDDIKITIGYQDDDAQNSWNYVATVEYANTSQQYVFDGPCQNLPS